MAKANTVSIKNGVYILIVDMHDAICNSKTWIRQLFVSIVLILVLLYFLCDTIFSQGNEEDSAPGEIPSPDIDLPEMEDFPALADPTADSEQIEAAQDALDQVERLARANQENIDTLFSGRIIQHPVWLPDYENNIQTIAVDPTGEYLAFAGENQNIHVYETSQLFNLYKIPQLDYAQVTRFVDNLEPVIFAPHRDTIRWIGFMDLSLTLFSCGNDGKLIRSNYLNGEPQDTIVEQGFPIISCAYSSMRRTLAYGNQINEGNEKSFSVEFRDYRSPGERTEARLSNFGTRIWCLDWAHEANWLAIGDQEGTLEVWAVDEGRLLLDFQNPSEKSVGFVRFSKDDRVLIAGSADGTLRFFDPQNNWNYETLYSPLNQEIWCGTTLINDTFALVGGQHGLEVIRIRDRRITDQLAIGPIECIVSVPGIPGLFITDDALHKGIAGMWMLETGEPVEGRDASTRLYGERSYYFPVQMWE